MIQFYRLSSDENCKIREVTPAGSRQHENRAEAGDYSSSVRHFLYLNTLVNPDSLNGHRVRHGWWQETLKHRQSRGPQPHADLDSRKAAVGSKGWLVG